MQSSQGKPQLINLTFRQIYRGLHRLALLSLWLPVFVYAATTEHEPNNIQDDAVLLFVNDSEKTYKFDYSGDEDWFVFYAHKGFPYDIQITDKSVGKGINPAIELFNEAGEKEVNLFDFNFAGEGELLSWGNVPKDGFYFLRITNQETTYSTDNHYDLKVYLPLLPNNLVVKGRVIEQCTQQDMSDVVIESSANDSTRTRKGQFSLVAPPGSYTITAKSASYIDKSAPVTLEKVAVESYVIKNVDFELSPKTGCSSAPVTTPSTPVVPTVTPDQLKQSAVAVYDEISGELQVKDVRIGGDQRITATLKNQGEYKFKLLSVAFPQSAPHSTPAFYDDETALSNIPSVFAFDKLYRIKLRNIAGSDYLFALEGSPVALP